MYLFLQKYILMCLIQPVCRISHPPVLYFLILVWSVLAFLYSLCILVFFLQWLAHIVSKHHYKKAKKTSEIRTRSVYSWLWTRTSLFHSLPGWKPTFAFKWWNIYLQIRTCLMNPPSCLLTLLFFTNKTFLCGESFSEYNLLSLMRNRYAWFFQAMCLCSSSPAQYSMSFHLCGSSLLETCKLKILTYVLMP